MKDCCHPLTQTQATCVYINESPLASFKLFYALPCAHPMCTFDSRFGSFCPLGEEKGLYKIYRSAHISLQPLCLFLSSDGDNYHLVGGAWRSTECLMVDRINRLFCPSREHNLTFFTCILRFYFGRLTRIDYLSIKTGRLILLHCLAEKVYIKCRLQKQCLQRYGEPNPTN